MIDKKIAVARVVRTLLVLCLFFVIAATAWYFFSHRRPGSVEAVRVGDITEQKVEKQEGIEHYDYKGDRVIRAKAERHYAGSANLYYLEGNVEIKEVNKEGNKERIISGDKITYDKDWTEIVLEGQASLKLGDVAVKAPVLYYRKNPETLSTDKEATFASNRIFGRAQQLLYSLAEESLRLEGDVDIQLRRGPESPDVFVLKADVFIYSRPEKRGSAEGKVTFSLEKSHGRADSIEFRLTSDEQQIEKIVLKGKVKTFLVAGNDVPVNGGDFFLAKVREREIEAEEIRLNSFLDAPEMESLEARGNCFMKSVAASGSLTEVRSEAMKMLFDRQGGLKELRAWDQANLLEKGKDGSFKRRLSGQEILVEGQGELLWIRAGTSEEALLDSLDSEVMAREIKLFPERKIMEASEQVKIVLKPQPEKEETVGFFARERPVFIKTQYMRYDEQENRLILRGDIRMWQDKDMLLAQQATILRDTGEMASEGLVRSVFSLRPKKGEDKEERIELGGEKMNYNPKANILAFEQTTWLKTRAVGLKADSLFVSLAEKSADVKMVKARGKVIVADELREGQSEEALYDLEKETVVLSGSPVVTDKEKGILRGDKLTFRLGDDRILVENKEKERSATVIKREE